MIAEKLPLFILAAASCVATPLAQGQAMMSLELIPLSLRVQNALVAYAAYVGNFFWPVCLSVYYPHPGPALETWKPVMAAVALAAASLTAVAQRKHLPFLFVGWFWFVGMMLPMIGLVQVGVHAMADRYTYLSQIGLDIAVVWTAVWVIIKPSASATRRKVCAAAAALAVLALIAAAWRQTATWRDSESLWRQALACTSSNARAHNNLGIALAAAERRDEAVAEYQKALEIKADYTDALCNLGAALSAEGQTNQAEPLFMRVLKIDPHYVNARLHLGLLMAGRGNIDQAAEQFHEALRIRPHDAEVHASLGSLWAEHGRADEAIRELQTAVALKPTLHNAHFNLGVLLSERGQVAEALSHWREAIRLMPDDAGFLEQTAWTLATCPDAALRDGTEAVRLARRAVELSKAQEAAPLDTLAAALAESGRFDAALDAARQALPLAEQHNQADLAQAIRTRIALYESRKPYRESPGLQAP